MKFSISYKKKSLENAIQYLQQAKTKIVSNQLVERFLEKLSDWIIDKANRHLEASTIGRSIIADIQSSWKKIITGNTVKVVNKNTHAVYVEFGVGVIGLRHPHPLASEENYEYNLPSDAKFGRENEYWLFVVDNESKVDLMTGYKSSTYEDGRLAVLTKGSVGVQYAYKAISDAITDAQNSNGEIARMWFETKRELLG